MPSMSTKVYYGPDHRYWWVTELDTVPSVGYVLELWIDGAIRRYRVQRVTPPLMETDKLRVWTKQIDLSGPWVQIPPRWDDGTPRFNEVIQKSSWRRLALGEDLTCYRQRVDPPQIYVFGRYDLPALGTWSGDRTPDGEYLDSVPTSD